MSDEKLLNLVNVLQSQDVDAKVEALAVLQKEFEGRVELADWENVLNALKTCLRTSNQLLSAAALSTLVPYLSLLLKAPAPWENSSSQASLPPQDTHVLRQVLHAMLAPGGVLERLGDRERSQLKARQIVVLLGAASFQGSSLPSASTRGREKNAEAPVNVFERHLRELGLGSKVWKIREQSVLALLDIRRGQPMLPLRAYVPQLVLCLEDTDAHVRDTARQAVVEMFTSATETARTELKKEMTKKNVRKAIVDSVLTQLLSISAHPVSLSLTDTLTRPKEYVPPSVALSNVRRPIPLNVDGRIVNDFGAKEPPHRPASRSETSAALSTPAAEASQVQPVYVASTRDLDTEVMEMLRPFEGKETEHNWAARERTIIRIRGMLSGGVMARYPEAFRLHLKELLPITLKTLNSLRTTVCINTCALYSELALHFGPALDIHCDFLLSNLLRLANTTKKLSSQQSQAAVSALIIHVSPNPRVILPLLQNTLQEKNVQSRTYALSHVRQYLSLHGANSRALLETSGGVDILERIVRKALVDPNPAVKESARTCFWLLQPLWPERAISIHSALDLTGQNQLDRTCPHSDKGTSTPAPSRPNKKTSVAAAIAASRAKARAIAAAPPTLRHQVTSHTHSSNLQRSSSPAPSSRNSQPGSPVSLPFPRSPPTDAARRRTLSPNRSSQTPSPPNSPPLKRRTPPSSSSTNGRSSPMPHIDSASAQSLSSSVMPAPVIASSPHPTLRNSQGVSDIDAYFAAHGPIPLDAILARDLHLPGPQTSPTHTTFALPISTAETALPHPSEAVDLVESSSTTALSLPVGDCTSPDRGLSIVPPPIVEEALRSRAEQAESTAERLLELVEPEEMGAGGSVALGELDVATLQWQTSGPPSTPKHRSKADDASHSILQRAALFQESPSRTGSDLHIGAKRPTKLVDVLNTRQGEAGWWARRLTVLGHDSVPEHFDVAQRQQDFSADVDQLAAGESDMQTLCRMISFCSQTTALPTGGEHKFELLIPGTTADNSSSDVGRLFDAVLKYLTPDKASDLLEAGLVLLWELIEHQFAEIDGREADIFSVLLRVRYSADTHVLDATNAVRDALIPKMEPVYGLTTMHASLRAFYALRSSAIAVRYSTFAFGLIALGKFVLRLPPEVAEEELPRLKETLTTSLNEKDSLVVREAAAAAVIAAQFVMQDETQLFALLDGLADEKKNLLAYLFDKHSVRSTQSSRSNGRGAGGVDKLHKEMKRLDRRTSLLVPT